MKIFGEVIGGDSEVGVVVFVVTFICCFCVAWLFGSMQGPYSMLIPYEMTFCNVLYTTH